MENYELEQDEVVLYKGKVSLPQLKGETELILTNYNFVLITKQKKLFSKEKLFVETYPVVEIKFYKGVPQVLKKGHLVELYFLNDETEFTFESGSECRKFVNVSMNLLTNKNLFERSVDKIKSSISIVDNSLGINSKSIAETAIKNGVIGKTTNVLGKSIKGIANIVKKK